MLSFKNKRSFLQKIDALPCGPGWQCEIWEAKGDELDENGEHRIEVLEMWKCDPVECIRELIGHLSFQDCLCYAPEEIFEDPYGEKRMYNEMWTAEWWRDIQVSTT